MCHELLCPVLPVLFMLPVQKHLGLIVDHTLHKEHYLQKALGLLTAHTPSQKQTHDSFAKTAVTQSVGAEKAAG